MEKAKASVIISFVIFYNFPFSTLYDFEICVIINETEEIVRYTITIV